MDLPQITDFEKAETENAKNATEETIKTMQADYKTSVVEPTINKIIEEDITENIINDFKTAFKFTDKEFQTNLQRFCDGGVEENERRC